MKTIKINFKKNTISITSYLLMSIISLFLLNSCSEEGCDYDQSDQGKTCTSNGPNNEHAGFTVNTNYMELGTGSIGKIFDTRMNSNAPLGDDWVTTTSTQVTTITPSNWTPNDIGQVFGIAIDDDENIYLAASDVYSTSGYSYVNPNPGRIYKCSPPNYNAISYIDLPNSGGTSNGIGNIAYDKKNQQLFATNLEDGKIYRISTGASLATGTVLESYDPWTADVPTSGIVSQDEQVWGIGVNYELSNSLVKVYFPRVATTVNPERSMYSITLNSDGSMPTTAAVLEYTSIPGNQNRITDVALSSNKDEMLIAERGNAHGSKVMSYDLGGSWTFNLQYFVGGSAGNDGENSAGGVDFAYTEAGGDISSKCSEYFWASGNWMDARNSSLSKVYGMEGISYAGNNSTSAVSPTANQDTDIFIDFDGLTGTSTKGSLGDVEVFDSARCFDVCDIQ